MQIQILNFIYQQFFLIVCFRRIVGEKAALQLERVRSARSRRENAEQLKKGRFTEYVYVQYFVCGLHISAFKYIIIYNFGLFTKFKFSLFIQTK